MKDLIITIFGSTGDLTSRKLLPAISKLYQNHQIPEQTLVICLGRRTYQTKEYLQAMNESAAAPLNLSILEKIVIYQHIEITDPNDYDNLVSLIKKERKTDTKELYYLAVGPDLFPVLSTHINQSKLVTKGNLNQSIIFEKPFGNDLKSAKEINQLLWQYFDEKQI